MLLLLACTPSDSADSGPPVDTGWTWDEAPVPTELVGWVHVIEHPAYGGGLDVQFWDGPQPTTLSVSAQEGDCTLLTGAPLYGECTPSCDYSTQTCIDGECVDYPHLADAGVVTVSGLSPGDATLSPSQGWYAAPVDFDGDLFDVGAPIHAAATGGLTAAFTLDAIGVEPLTADVEGRQLTPGEDFTVGWTPPTTSHPSRVRLMLETGWHGVSSMTTLWCETDDDGELVIPGSLTGTWQSPSCGECEWSELQRFTRDVLSTDAGPIELLVASQVDWLQR